MDGMRRIAYCIDPYGNTANLSFSSGSATVVVHALRALLDKRVGWTMKVTTHGWQAVSDWHSCGIWAAWLAHKFMQFTVDNSTESDFERWASMDVPPPSLLRSAYHEMFYKQNPSMLNQQMAAVEGTHAETHKPSSKQIAKAQRSSVRLPKATEQHQSQADASAKNRPATLKLDADKLQMKPIIMKRRPTAALEGITLPPAHRPEVASRPQAGRPIPEKGRAALLKRQEKRAGRPSAKATDRLHSVPELEQPPPLRNVQLTAALGKAWVQPKLSFANKPAKNSPQPRAQQAIQRYTLQLGEAVGAQGAVAAEQMQRESVPRPMPGAVEEGSSPTPIDPDSPYSGENLSLLTWNVMGLTAVQEDLRHLLNPKRDGKPIDIMVLTETKLIPQQHGKLWLKTLFEGWQTHFKSKCLAESAQKQEQSRSGSGGVVVACRKTGLGSAFQRTEDVPQRLAGHFELLKSSKYNLWVVGVSMPCNDLQMRTELYDFLGIVVVEASRSKADLIAAGDWNAAWQSTDKCSGNLSSAYNQHRLALDQMGLCPFQAEHRSKTFGCMLSTGASRIDDIFISSNSKLKPDDAPAEEVLSMGERSDHLPLKITLTLPKASSSSTSPIEQDTSANASTTPLGFVRPLNAGQKQMLRCHLEGFQMSNVSKIADEVGQVYEEVKALHSCNIGCMEPDQPVPMAARAQFGLELEHKSITKQTVDAMAHALTGLISQMNLAALDVLPAMPDPRKRKLFRPRVMGRKYQMLRRERKSLIQQIL